ncbi:hypothetical protein MANES_05G074200v8 [Manihot esculenta]|uniref:Bifunctional inhibitor/plant lipid transfer protein/seed storage helical domain-containing protein n=1 Tax=Manihot esculenta TaxID=3983 RepID=A0A2C9VWL4_MANES|nr:hypothetical protein MANES_05G074200v8 [Manihot esculenta]
MGRIKILVLTCLTGFLLLMPAEVDGVPHPARSVCISQISLANYACGGLDPSPISDIFHHHHHGHGHRHNRHGSLTHETPTESCCRWLNNVENECVCDLLIQLPAFLSKPAHQLTVVIGEYCRVTFSCSGRVRP